MPSTLQLQQKPLVVSDRNTIIRLAAVLESLAARCGQAGEMHWLPYFLDRRVTARRFPYLVLFVNDSNKAPEDLQVDDVFSAALFFGYKVMGIRTRVVLTDDGLRSVLAPAGERTQTAYRAMLELVRRGAALALATFHNDGELHAVDRLEPHRTTLIATRPRRVGRALKLLPTLAETLAQFGRSTRLNLTRYRRRAEKELGCEFVAEVGVLLQGADLSRINNHCLNPVPISEFERRVQSASGLRGSFLCGVRTPDGEWLSLLGGWRQEDTTVLHWQCNAAGYEKLSLSTVMRSYFIEHEIGRGARRMLFYGGTPHTMRRAFDPEPVMDLLVMRRGLRAQALRWCASLLQVASRSLPIRPNHLANLLRDPELEWHGIPPRQRPVRSLEFSAHDVSLGSLGDRR